MWLKGNGEKGGFGMKFLKLLTFLVFVLALFQASMVMGLIDKTPVLSQVLNAYLKQSDQPHLYYPCKIYARIGNLIWSSKYIDDILGKIYKPIVREAGLKAFKSPGNFWLDLNLLNWAVLGGLGAFLLLSLLSPRRGNRR